ncbi:MAG TPA: HEAT repeat domain-containing protein [bacterium]|nr:HEAT repeat domain-containing protein [bacterium]
MLNPAQTQLASSAVRELRVALSNFFLYSAGNDMITKSLERFLGSLELLFETLPSVGLGESEGQLLVEGSQLNERMTGSTNMIKDLFLTHKIQSLTFLKGITVEEIKSLFEMLKPKALPSGISLVQALVQKPINHIRLNEKVFVAIKEGEKVVSAEGLPAGEENLQEALEALQYFLQIFSRVRPESNKREVARKMVDNMGGWLLEGLNGAPGKGEPGGGPGGQAGGGMGSGGQSLMEIMAGLSGLRQSLANMKDPAQFKNAQIGMDDVLKKLVLLAESQGVPAAELEKASVEGSGEKQQALFETDNVLADLKAGKWNCLKDSALERAVDDRLTTLQAPEEAEVFEPLWEALWNQVLSGAGEARVLGLRHLNRLHWHLVPRHLQLDGLRNLKKFLVDFPEPSTYPIALTLAQDWLPQEVDHPDWEEFLEITWVLKQAAEKSPPLFDRQDLAAKAALGTIFCEPVLDRVLAGHLQGERDKVMRLLSLLGPLASELLFEKVQVAVPESPEWGAAVDLLSGMEAGGVKVFEPWVREKGEKLNLVRFLEIFKRAPLPGHLADYFEKHWTSFAPEVQGKVLEVAELWKRVDFRHLLLGLLKKPETPIAVGALKVLAKVGLEGDSREIVAAVKNYPSQASGRERFWAAACQALGELGDPLAIDPLMEWADKYKFLEHKKERGLEVRRAAIEALGHFRSNTVKTFLSSLQKEGEKELKTAVEKSIKSVDEKLAQPQDAKEN